MAECSNVKINLSSGEIEINGSEAFINDQLDKVKDILLEFYGKFDSEEIKIPSEAETNSDDITQVAVVNNKEEKLPDSFGEFLNKFPKSINQGDQVLIAGYYLQKKCETNDFKTSDANKALKEQGVKLTNAADSLKKLCESKKVFINKKTGKLSLFRVSKLGEEHIISMLSTNVE